MIEAYVAYQQKKGIKKMLCARILGRRNKDREKQEKSRKKAG